MYQLCELTVRYTCIYLALTNYKYVIILSRNTAHLFSIVTAYAVNSLMDDTLFACFTLLNYRHCDGCIVFETVNEKLSNHFSCNMYSN